MMKNGWLRIFIPFLTAVVLAGCDRHRERIILAEEGEARYVVYLGEREGEVTRHAAEEMAKYLQEISGAPFRVTHNADTAAPKIVIGLHNSLAGQNTGSLKTDLIKADGFCIKKVGEDIFIAGTIERGTLYGVYYFLDRLLGVRWFSPDFTVVPEKKTLVADLSGEGIHNPRFLYREVFDGQDDGDYRQHNLLNGNRFHRQGLRYDAGINTWSSFVPGGAPPRYGGHNFYEVVPGEECHEGGQLRAMDEPCREQAVRYFLKTIPEYGTDIWYAFTQRDNGWEPDSLSLRFAEEHGGVLSAPVIDMVKAVAGEVREMIPEAKFATFAYQFTFDPPRDLPVPDYLLVETAPIHADFGKPFDHPDNAGIDSALRGWNRIAGNLGVWTYNANFQNYLQPLPNIYPMCEDVQYLSRLEHFKEYFGQGSYSTAGGEFTGLRSWVLARLLWNPHQDYRVLIKEFTEGFYGPAAPWIREYIDLLHKSLEKNGDRISSKQRITSKYLDLDFVLRADSLMRLAEDAAGERYASHVHRVRLGVDMTILLREAWYRAEAERRGVVWKEDPQRLRRFRVYVQEAGITAYNEDTPIEGLFKALAIDRVSPSVPDTLAGGREWVDLQDLDFNICCGAELVEDPRASDHGAVRYHGKEWAIQVKMDLLPSQGAWELYAGVRCSVKKGSDPRETAFHMGIWPGEEIAPRVEQVEDGKYHLFRVPGGPVAYQTGRAVWFTSGEGTDSIFVDRIIAVKVK